MTRLLTTAAIVVAAISPLTVPVAGQEPPKPSIASRPYVPPRTPWGDPNLQGNYTNKYEQSTPLERPEEFVGRRVEDVTGAELADILEKRHQQVVERPAGVGPFSVPRHPRGDEGAAARGWSSIRLMAGFRR